MTQGTVFDIQRYSIHDGPGIRTTVFLKGCPLRCPWCANPESQVATPQIGFKRRLCRACGACIAACPRGAVLEHREFGRIIDHGDCDLCLECVLACPTGALEKTGVVTDSTAVAEEVIRDSIFYRRSGGGVTVGGGEPYYQADFLLELVRDLKREGMHVVVDTTGFVPWDDLEATLPFVDLFLYDLKAIDEALHVSLTGVGNRGILGNLRRIVNEGKNVWVRVPVVPGYTDGAENMEAIGDYVADLGRVVAVTLLPYHRLGCAKYGQLGLRYSLDGVEPPTADHLAQLREILVSRTQGVPVEIG